MSGRTVRFVTSFTDSLYQASGRRCVTSFKQMNPQHEMVAYVECKDDTSLSKIDADLSGLGVRSIHLIDLPVLAEFERRAARYIPESLGGTASEECPKLKQSPFNQNMIRWFRKIVAVENACEGFGGIVIWLDSDCFCKQPLISRALQEAFCGAGVFYMKGHRGMSETGLVGYDLEKPRVSSFVKKLLVFYLDMKVFELSEGWSDSHVFDAVRVQSPEVCFRDIVSRFAVGLDVIRATRIGSYIEHDKGLHGRLTNTLTEPRDKHYDF